MTPFFRFPHTPHLAWLGPGQPRDDKVMSPQEAGALLQGEVTVEEKLDGANLGISIDPALGIRVQNRGQYLEFPYRGQFARLSSWLVIHQNAFDSYLAPELILFGEWCTARHSLKYNALPDWFLAFDVYDRRAGRFWSTSRRDAFVAELGLSAVPEILTGNTTVADLKTLLQSEDSRFRNGQQEGIIVRRENNLWLESRAKLVHPAFTQTITEHWSRRSIEWNQLG